jgi:Putative MetA-pathway of phenol degradation
MNRRLLLACLFLAIFYLSDQACAQFTDPRTYANTPVGINQLELNYAYVHANASIDTSLIVTGAHLNLNQGIIDYTRYFGLLHRLMWVEAGVPVASLGGSVTGTNIQGSASGAGDSSYQLAMLLKGGPALSVAQFENYEATTCLGASLTISSPTGLYHGDRILNLGSDRWSFKPEIALSHPFGREQKWEFDTYANVYSIQTTLRIVGERSCNNSRCPELKDT